MTSFQTYTQTEVPVELYDALEGGAPRQPKRITDSLALGDIIKIKAPKYVDYNNRTFFVTYLDSTILQIVNIADADQTFVFRIHDGRFSDVDVDTITVVNSSSEKGYARQNGLVQGVWTDIAFGGEVPRTYTAEITNLEEDMIELTTYPDNHVMYIDFAFRGIPRDVPIISICVRDKPESAAPGFAVEREISEPGSEEKQEDEREVDTGDILEDTLEEPDATFADQLAKIYHHNDDVEFGNILDSIQVNVEISANYQKYGIYAQVDDLLDACLSTIPDAARTAMVMTDIRLLIQRYQELRAMYSKFDGDSAIGFLDHDPCPAATQIASGKVPGWAVPVVSQRKKLYIDTREARDAPDVVAQSYPQTYINRVDTANALYYDNKNPSDTIKYANMYAAMAPFYQTTVPLTNDASSIATVTVPATTEIVLSTNASDPFRSSGFTVVGKGGDNEEYQGSNTDEGDESTTNVKKTKHKRQLKKKSARFGNTATNDEEEEEEEEEEKDDYEGEDKDTEPGQIISVPFATSRSVAQTLYPASDYKAIKSKENTTYSQLIPGDKVTWQSLLVFPSSVVMHTANQVRSASIYDRSAAAQTPLYKYDVYDHMAASKIWNTRHVGLPSSSSSSSASNETLGSGHQWDNVVHMKPSELAASEPADRLRSFLRASLPTTNDLLANYVSKYCRPMAWSQVVHALEPFGVHPKDLAQEYMPKFRAILSENQSSYRHTQSTGADDFRAIIKEEYATGEPRTNSSFLEQLFSGSVHGKENMQLISKYYQDSEKESNPQKQKQTKSSEAILNAMLAQDNGRFMSAVLSSDTVSLLADVKENPEYTPFDPEKVDVSCQNRVIAKKYGSTDALTADNNRDAFFDPLLDPTDYELGNQWKLEHRQSHSKLSLVDFFVGQLTAHHNATEKEAKLAAETMIAGKRKVKDGEHALLEIVPKLADDVYAAGLSEAEQEAIRIEMDVRKKRMFYIRKHNSWAYDASLDDLSFADMNDVICGLQASHCVSRKPKPGNKKGTNGPGSGSGANTCESTRTMLLTERANLLREVTRRYDSTVAERAADIQVQLKSIELKRANRATVRRNADLGNDIKNWTYGKRAVLANMVQSPFRRVLDAIMSTGVSEDSRHEYILKFVDKFCREPYVADLDESPHWMYCIETGTKLVPRSQHMLAQAYRDGTYTATLAQLCCRGVQSEDGESIIDPHTGFMLRRLEFAEDYVVGGDEFAQAEADAKDWGADARRRIVDVVSKTITLPSGEIAAVYADPVDQLFYNIISVFMRHIGVYDAELKGQAMKWCTLFGKQGRLVASAQVYKKSYNEALKRREANPKVPVPDEYSVYLKKTRIYLAVMAIMVVVQTAVPEIEVRKTYPGCSRNLGDWPLNTDETKLGTLAYFACVTRKMHETGPDAATIPKAALIQKMFVPLFTNIVTVLPEVDALYARKRDYLAGRDTGLVISANIPVEVNVAVRWPQFMPPTFPVTIPAGQLTLGLPSPSSSSSSDSSRGRSVASILRAKVRSFTMAIVQFIREHVGKQHTLRNTRAGMPFLENACCESPPAGHTTTLQYFEREDDTIKSYVSFLAKLEITINKIGRSLVPPTGIVAANTSGRRRLPGASGDETSPIKNSAAAYSTDLMYLALIKFCHLDSTILPIPDDMISICAEKPSDRSDVPFPADAPINEQIAYLNQNNIHMSADRMIALLNVIYSRHPVKRVDTTTEINTEETNLIWADKRRKRQDALTLLVTYCDAFHVSPALNTVKTLTAALCSAATEDAAFDAEVALAAQVELENAKESAALTSFLRSTMTNEKKDALAKQVALLTSMRTMDMFRDDVPLDTVRNHAMFILDQFGVAYPSAIQNPANVDEVVPTVPTHWNLLPQDEAFLKTVWHLPLNTEAARGSSGTLIPLCGNPLLCCVAQAMVDRYTMLRKFIHATGVLYSFAPVDGVRDSENEDESAKIFRKRNKELYLFLILQVLRMYRDLIVDPVVGDKIQRASQKTRNQGNLEYEERSDENVYGAALMDADRVEVLLTDTRNQTQRAVAEYTWAMLGTLKTRQRGSEPVTMSYADVMREVDFSRDREKQKVKEYFGAMPAEERKLEMLMKSNRLGTWAVATDKLNVYGAGQALFGQRDEVLNTDAVETDNGEFDYDDVNVESNEEDTPAYRLDEDADNLNNDDDENDEGDMYENAYDTYGDGNGNE